MSKLQRTYTMEIQGRSGKLHTFSMPLTVQFDVTRSAYGSLNVGHFTLRNLSRNTRLDLQYDYQYEPQTNRTFSFYAGWASEGTQPLVFIGSLQKAFSYREGPDVITDITVLDGGYAAIWAQIEHTVNKFNPERDIPAIAATLSKFGITLGAVGSLFKNYDPSTDNGLVSAHNSWDKLRGLAEDLGGYAFIDFGKIYMMGQNDVLATAGPVPQINASTGLIGTPRRSGWTVDAVMEFEPGVTLLQQVSISSVVEPSANGTYAIQVISHRGMISLAVDQGVMTILTMVSSLNTPNVVVAL